jgi:hypothetical protein
MRMGMGRGMGVELREMGMGMRVEGNEIGDGNGDKRL